MVVLSKPGCDCSYCFDRTDIDAVRDRVVLLYPNALTEFSQISDMLINCANR